VISVTCGSTATVVIDVPPCYLPTIWIVVASTPYNQHSS
jgi:hypothetical protein